MGRDGDGLGQNLRRGRENKSPAGWEETTKERLTPESAKTKETAWAEGRRGERGAEF